MAIFKSKAEKHKVDNVPEFIQELKSGLEREVAIAAESLSELHKNLRTGLYVWEDGQPKFLEEQELNGKNLTLAAEVYVDKHYHACLAFPIRLAEIRISESGDQLVIETREIEDIVINPEVVYEIIEKYSKK